MAIIGALDKTKHFSEFNDPLFGNTGTMTPAQRKAAARTNLGVASATVLSTVTGLTDSSGGTAGNTIADVPGTYTEATLANQLASLTAKINEIIVALGGTDPNA